MRCPNGALQKQKKAYNEDVGSNGPTSMIPWLDHPDSGAVIKPASKTPPYCMSSMGIIFETSNDGQSGILDLRPCKKRMPNAVEKMSTTGPMGSNIRNPRNGRPQGINPGPYERGANPEEVPKPGGLTIPVLQSHVL
ncbi:hypothetical protein sscle_07g058670 [Sclerotinia sclerotiorum 1980 UF-70]|nr:hypothetical protein sscle_07g058670 [Sclerotinia sclerotiorum 1980 UF-70]